MLNGNKPDWMPDWENQYVAVVGAGGSIKRSEVDSLQGRIKVIVINQSYELCLWADALYSCDAEWWKKNDGAKKFPGLKISHDPIAVQTFPEIRKVSVKSLTGLKGPTDWSDELEMDEYGIIGGGGSSGFQTVNLCAQWKVKGMMLLGFDMCFINSKAHWHGQHPFPMNNPIQSNFNRWKKALESNAPKLRQLGIEVINCSMESALGCFPRQTVSDTLARWKL